MTDTEPDALHEAVREAKRASGLNPGKAYPPMEFVEALPDEWQQPFWARQIERTASGMFEEALIEAQNALAESVAARANLEAVIATICEAYRYDWEGIPVVMAVQLDDALARAGDLVVLREHDAKVLRDAAEEWETLVQREAPPVRGSVWLKRRADAVEKGQES